MKIDRRDFLSSISCGAYLAGLAAAAPVSIHKAFASLPAKDDVVAKDKFARIEKIAERCWAVVSTPFEDNDFTTVCNGGIIAGKDSVLVVESYMQPAGAGWVSKWAKELTGSWPTDVISTHYHADHTAGFAGFVEEGNRPNFWLTDYSRGKVLSAATGQQEDERAKLESASLMRLSDTWPTDIDLGGRTVRIVPRRGHTDSDITIELLDPQVMFCGDLYFHRMIPNYSDARPVELNQQIESILKSAGATERTYIPGHGAVTGFADLVTYRDFLGFIQEYAERSVERGKSVEQAAEEFKLGGEFEDWFIFAPTVVPRAMQAWYRALDADL